MHRLKEGTAVAHLVLQSIHNSVVHLRTERAFEGLLVTLVIAALFCLLAGLVVTLLSVPGPSEALRRV